MNLGLFCGAETGLPAWRLLRHEDDRMPSWVVPSVDVSGCCTKRRHGGMSAGELRQEELAAAWCFCCCMLLLLHASAAASAASAWRCCRQQCRAHFPIIIPYFVVLFISKYSHSGRSISMTLSFRRKTLKKYLATFRPITINSRQ